MFSLACLIQRRRTAANENKTLKWSSLRGAVLLALKQNTFKRKSVNASWGLFSKLSVQKYRNCFSAFVQKKERPPFLLCRRSVFLRLNDTQRSESKSSAAFPNLSRGIQAAHRWPGALASPPCHWLNTQTNTNTLRSSHVVLICLKMVQMQK